MLAASVWPGRAYGKLPRWSGKMTFLWGGGYSGSFGSLEYSLVWSAMKRVLQMINPSWEAYVPKTKEVLLRHQRISFPLDDPYFPCHEVAPLPSSNHSNPSPAERKRCTSFASNKMMGKGARRLLELIEHLTDSHRLLNWDNCQFENSQRWKMYVCVCELWKC